MYQKIEIEEFCNRIMRDRSLRINKDLLTGICAQAMQAVDLLELNQSLQHDLFELAKEQEAARLALPKSGIEMTHAEALQVAADINELPVTVGMVRLTDTRLDGLNADEMSLDEILDNPLSSVPDSGTIVAGGNPECDTQTQKSKQPSSAKAKPPQR